MLVGRGALAEDLVQDTIERALRAHTRPIASEVQPWLMRILRNLVIDCWRSPGRKPTAEVREDHLNPHEDHHSPYEEEAPEPWWRAVTQAEVMSAINGLPPRFRDPLLLHLEGVSYAEMAIRLSIKAPTVGTRLHRGRRCLREKLAANIATAAQQER